MDAGWVCDHCDRFKPMERDPCPHARSEVTDAITPESDAMNCPKCGTHNPDGFRFCGNCGQKLEAQTGPAGDAGGARTLYFGDMQKPDRAKLILIKGEGLDGVAYHLNANEHTAGREDGEIRFHEDPLLSPRHACFYYENGTLTVRDENSANGVFVRITQPVPLNAGSRFLVGEQLIQYDVATGDEEQPEADADGTYFYGSPRRPGHFKLVQILRGGDIGMIFRAPNERVTLGREGNDINFPDDPFISGQHSMVTVGAEGGTLTDMGSKNGTFVRIEQPHALAHGDYVFLGQQLMRVEVS